MYKRVFGIFIAVALIILTFTGCGSGNKQNDAAGYVMATTSAAANKMDLGYSGVERENGGYSGSTVQETIAGVEDGAYEMDEDSQAPAFADSLAGTGSTLTDVSNAILSERKIIRSANLTIEVENFDEARNNINSIINGIGIVQESSVVTDRVYVEGELKLIKRGTIVLRVYKEKFDTVFNNVKGIGDVLNESINGQDVTDRFVDTESRLRLLKLEQSRLEAYLEKLEDLDKIFKTESRLTEIRQQIESLTGNLNKMSSLVELSTITLTMNEKNPNAVKQPKELTYGERLLEKLKSSLEGVVDFLGDLMIFVVAAIPVLILLGLFVLLGVFIYRRIPGRAKARYEAGNANRKEAPGGKQEE